MTEADFAERYPLLFHMADDGSWPSIRAHSLLGARASRGRAHLVKTLDTAVLLADCAAQVRLSPINSGRTPFVPRKRGHATFRSTADHPASTPVVMELTMEGGVPDIATHVVRLERCSDGVAQTDEDRTPAFNPAL